MEVIILPWKDPSSNAFFSWIYIILFGAWGGFVRYILDVKSGRSGRNLFSALAQIIVSGFTGVLSGLMSQSLGTVFHTTLAISGISGAMGVVALNYYWKKISGDSNDKS
ncbi:holin [Citrobacter sp. wls715]|uniref:Phage holin family protein n=1 Tax=Citrobacter pasteurii TaxID=1563222 RepID=A0ABX8KE59_9ENTR|nr:phage holin family protein [Citrobacter pasteurii]MBA7943071.1 phage holin family protein [Citrobacter sp. RHBSTW-00271]MBD0802182.1 phage holin family protein [Citrobacter sp. C6_1]MBD0811035.1 phage holin family protein [Citrobacter sp. C6_2]TKU53064.1 holin [Citrobacter sp. wls715]